MPNDFEAVDAKLTLGTLSTFVGYTIRVAQITAFREFEARRTEFGLAPRYFGLVMLIESNPDASQTARAKAIQLGRPAILKC